MRKLLDKTKAVVEIEITGAFPGDMINRLAADSVPFWSVEKVNELTWHLSMYGEDYLKIRKTARKAMCKTHIIKKTGLPFMTKKMKRRKLLITGVVAAVLAALIMPMFIWTFEVEGNEHIEDEKVIRALDEIGIGIGTFGYGINVQLTETKMLLKIPELSWLTVNVSGGKATISVREELPKPEILDETMVTDLVATNTGVITKMEILRGQSLFQKGQTVLKGEKLVSGYVEHMIFDKPYKTQPVRSMGEVYARTWRRLTALMPVDYMQKTYTGEESTKYSLIIGTKRINFYIDSGNYRAKCDKIIKRHNFTLPEGVTFPVGIEAVTEREYELVSAPWDESDAQKVLEKYLLSAIKGQMLGGEILKTSLDASASDGLMTVSVTCECQEQIAAEVIATSPKPENTDTNEGKEISGT